MNNTDRGFIKWMPFDSVTSTKKIVSELKHKKEIIEKPILSDEEIYNIEKKIIESFWDKKEITISYFKNVYINKITNKIKKIDQIYKLIYLNNNCCLQFNQITSIETK